MGVGMKNHPKMKQQNWISRMPMGLGRRLRVWVQKIKEETKQVHMCGALQW
jgi:hypothetical protein